jgi:CheY-like chemotaxis protein
MPAAGPLLPVLIVEDNADHLELTREALEEVGIQNRVDTAASVQEAVDYLKACKPVEGKAGAPPCVILLDIRLPDGSGMEVLRMAKQDPALRTIPVVMLTSSADTPDIEKAYLLGANSYLVKPVVFDEFHQRIRDAGLYWALLNQPLSN